MQNILSSHWPHSRFSIQIALQFPDELLRDSVPIFRRLKARLGEGHDLYVLADTSYGRQDVLVSF